MRASNHSVGTAFVHSIFEGSPSKQRFHGTHGTPSGSATVSYVRKNTLLAAKGWCICTPLTIPKSATAGGFSNWFLLGTGRMPHLVGGAMGVTLCHGCEKGIPRFDIILLNIYKTTHGCSPGSGTF